MKRTWRWVSRNSDSYYFVWRDVKKPTRKDGRYFYGEDDGVAVCQKEFTRLFGIAVEYDTCIKVEFLGARVIA